MKKLVILDFDGTLVNTLTDVAICFNRSLDEYGFPTHPIEQYKDFVGGNLETVVSRLLPSTQVNEENIDLVKNYYREIYLESPKLHSKPYPGMERFLERLADVGVRVGINTNKGQALTDALCGTLFPDYPFIGIYGYMQGQPFKPDPHAVCCMMEEAGADKSEAVYIGDGKNDIQTAENAGVDMVLVSWGQGTDEDFKNPYVTTIVDTVDELIDIVIPKSAE